MRKSGEIEFFTQRFDSSWIEVSTISRIDLHDFSRFLLSKTGRKLCFHSRLYSLLSEFLPSCLETLENETLFECNFFLKMFYKIRFFSVQKGIRPFLETHAQRPRLISIQMQGVWLFQRCLHSDDQPRHTQTSTQGL